MIALVKLSMSVFDEITIVGAAGQGGCAASSSSTASDGEGCASTGVMPAARRAASTCARSRTPPAGDHGKHCAIILRARAGGTHN